MERKYHTLPQARVDIDCSGADGEFTRYRHVISHGGINNFPLPPKVSRGLAALKPRLVRTFIQEYFHNMDNPDKEYDWSLLDPYLESLAVNGAKIVACICVKPPALFPAKDQRIFMPNDIKRWQNFIAAMVNRYTVEKQWVEYWEIGNETDIGETGGCPYLMDTPEKYIAYYTITAEAIKSAAPDAKIGGPAVANPRHGLVEGLLKHCRSAGLPLDFISWHVYSDDPAQHAAHANHILPLIKKYYPDSPPETMVTEFGKGFDSVCVEESAFDGYRAAAVMSCVFAMMETGVDYTFYYHIWDQVFLADQFAGFFEEPEIMLTHWDSIPHRMGMFGVCEEARPVYSAYRLLGMMGGARLGAKSSQADLRVVAASAKVDPHVAVASPQADLRGVAVAEGANDIHCVNCSGGTIKAMLVNYNLQQSHDLVARVNFNGIQDGPKLLTVYRADPSYASGDIEQAPRPTEKRYVDARGGFYCNIYCPADSVSLVCIEPTTEDAIRKNYL